MAILSFAFANYHVSKTYGLSYAAWALALGLLISNTVGTPEWLKFGVKTEINAFLGRDGLAIADAWRDGAQAYLGMTTSGFPNLFMLYGPNTNNGSLIYMLELEVDYAVAHIRHMQGTGRKWMDVRKHAMDAYNDQLQRDIASITVWGTDCRGYYRSESGRVVTQLPYDMTTFHRMTQAPDFDAYDMAN